MATYTIDRFTTKNRYLGSKTFEAKTLQDAVMFTAAWASFYRGRNQSFRIDDGSGRDRVMVLATSCIGWENLWDVLDTLIEKGPDPEEYNRFCEQERRKLLQALFN